MRAAVEVFGVGVALALVRGRARRVAAVRSFGDRAERRRDLLIVADAAEPLPLLEAYDHLPSGWWRSVERYRRAGTPPAVVMICADEAQARARAALAHHVLTACLAEIGGAPEGWERPGRRGVHFVAEGALHRGEPATFTVPLLAPALRGAAAWEPVGGTLVQSVRAARWSRLRCPVGQGSTTATEGSAMTTTACDRYLTEDGSRELVILDGAEGSRLLVDRRESDGSDARLLAHLASDEPDANAWLVCREFLADSWRGARLVRASDYRPLSDAGGEAELLPFRPAILTDAEGRRYFLRASGAPAELRWHREPRRRGAVPRPLSARDVVGALEAYEPVCTLTRAAVARFRLDRGVSVATLSVELRRIESSPIVLNRRLREAVLDAVSEHGVSFSAIAMACGRIKRDRRGNGSGETSWLARRVGLLPAAAGARPNPWVHSDTLALIARDGLGIAPREVELP